MTFASNEAGENHCAAPNNDSVHGPIHIAAFDLSSAAILKRDPANASQLPQSDSPDLHPSNVMQTSEKSEEESTSAAMAQPGVQVREDDTQQGETGILQSSKAAAKVDPVEADMPDSTSPCLSAGLLDAESQVQGVAVSRCEPSDPSRMEHEQTVTVVSETDMEGRTAASSSPQQDSPGGLAQDCESITSSPFEVLYRHSYLLPPLSVIVYDTFGFCCHFRIANKEFHSIL